NQPPATTPPAPDVRAAPATPEAQAQSEQEKAEREKEKKERDERARKWRLVRGIFAFGAICFLLAGAAGGVIAATLPHTFTLAEFTSTPLESRFVPFWKWHYKRWSLCEHGFFWLGIAVVVVATAAHLW